jgi:hypothetical protein
MQKERKPQFLVVYRCEHCGMDSGLSDIQEPECFYCDDNSALTLISKEPITPEALAARMKLVTDRMMDALRDAYEVMPEIDEPTEDVDEDPERAFLNLMAKARELRDEVHHLELRDPENREEE